MAKGTEKKRRKRLSELPITPSICSIIGTLLLVVVVGLCIPFTLPAAMGYEVYEVATNDMGSSMPMGSVAYVKPVDPSELADGEVVVFRAGDATVARRVAENHADTSELMTKGDASGATDAKAISYGSVAGKVEASFPLLGKLVPLYASSVGRTYLLLTVGCGLMLNMLADRMRERQRAALDGSSETRRTRGLVGALRLTLMAALAGVFVASACYVAFVTRERSSSDAVYASASEEYTSESEWTVAPITIDFDALRSVNEDVVGWIYCEGTPINYPVLHGETNNTYLRTDYTREYNINGSIFVDADNHPGFVDASTIIYGHHMGHGAMFATLDMWAEQSYYEEHPVMWLLTPTQDYQVVLVSGHHVSAHSDMYDIRADHDDAFAAFLATVTADSDFVPVEGVTAEPQANYVMLSTCAYIFQDARYVLHGKLVPVQSAGGKPLVGG